MGDEIDSIQPDIIPLKHTMGGAAVTIYGKSEDLLLTSRWSIGSASQLPEDDVNVGVPPWLQFVHRSVWDVVALGFVAVEKNRCEFRK